MRLKTFAILAVAGVSLSACQQKVDEQAAVVPAPQSTATVVHVVEVPTPAPTTSSPPLVEVTTKPTPCGSEKLQDYLNLLPTVTAKEEIAKTLGHSRVRYIGLSEAKASASPTSARVTAGLGPDGRVKVFTCG